jgi:hypothetical protein
MRSVFIISPEGILKQRESMGIKNRIVAGSWRDFLDRSRVKDGFLISGKARVLRIAQSERFVECRKLPKCGDRENVALPRHGPYDNVADEISVDITGGKETGSNDGGDRS